MEQIFVLAEHRKGELRDITLEVLTLAHRIGREKSLEVVGVLLGQNVQEHARKLKGACHEILVMEDPQLSDYNADAYLEALAALIRQRRPRLCLMGHTAMGMDLAPALATRLQLPFVSDCLSLAFAGDRLAARRQIYGGKIDVQLTLKPSQNYLASIRPGSYDAFDGPQMSARTSAVDPPDWSLSRGRRFVEYIEAVLEDVDIAAADILVSIGRGIGKPENIPLVEAFARRLGATLSCSRPVADEGWLPKSRQVGTSGKTVRPKIYLALGISGAYQHQAGMKNAQTIIAVNTDPRAPIFNVAHYGIVADIFQVLPVLETKFN